MICNATVYDIVDQLVQFETRVLSFPMGWIPGHLSRAMRWLARAHECPSRGDGIS